MLLYPVWVGVTFLTLMPPTTERARQNLLDWAEQQTNTIHVTTVARLVGDRPGATDRAAVEAELRGVIASSAFTRRVYFWVPENGRRRIVAGLGPGRPWLIKADRPIGATSPNALNSPLTGVFSAHPTRRTTAN